MSALSTFSAFYFGHTVTNENRFIDFEESGTPRTATLTVGAYSMSAFLLMASRAMNDVGTNTYSFDVNRATRIVTLNSDAAFDLLGTTGPNVSQSTLALLGLPTADQISVTSVAGTSATGFEYVTQFPLQSYMPTSNNLKAGNAVVSKSASGNRVSVQTFGEERFMKCDFKYITNQNVSAQPKMRSTFTGVEDAITFFEYAVTKAPLEFMPNYNDRNTFEVLILESTPGNTDGTGYELKELYDRGLPYFYDTGVMTFRAITEN